MPTWDCAIGAAALVDSDELFAVDELIAGATDAAVELMMVDVVACDDEAGKVDGVKATIIVAVEVENTKFDVVPAVRMLSVEKGDTDAAKIPGTEIVKAEAAIATDTFHGVTVAAGAAIEGIEPMPSAGG